MTVLSQRFVLVEDVAVALRMLDICKLKLLSVDYNSFRTTELVQGLLSFFESVLSPARLGIALHGLSFASVHQRLVEAHVLPAQAPLLHHRRHPAGCGRTFCKSHLPHSKHLGSNGAEKLGPSDYYLDGRDTMYRIL
jgi:hypothetical protein